MSTVIINVNTFLDAMEKGAAEDLYLQLRSTAIGDARAAKLAEALSSGYCPPGLQCELWYNEIGAAGAAKLVGALSSGRCPAGLQLNLDGNDIEEAVINQIYKLLEINEKKHAATLWVAFHHGLRPSHLLLKKIPDVVAQNIFSFLAPRALGKNLGLFFTQVKHKALPARLLASENASKPERLKSDPLSSVLGPIHKLGEE
jgi:hypothetical protein